ncbi:hypothetical protein [Natronococcus wangiae]|uniref:hypothetical protein n=1 Tax=Natronococcus wangiae TaxID=3068275 RepID=UPI00273FCA72|nr:hypothetical protein [Natronococcus sp. AD5]
MSEQTYVTPEVIAEPDQICVGGALHSEFHGLPFSHFAHEMADELVVNNEGAFEAQACDNFIYWRL